MAHHEEQMVCGEALARAKDPGVPLLEAEMLREAA